jgi:hypothetical protein
MATPETTAAAGIVAAQGAAAAAIGAAAPLTAHLADYGWASLFSLLGIMARHAFDASKTGSFDLKALAFDLPTAPMLGIVAFITALYFDIAEPIIPGIVILLGFLGPEWLRSLSEGLRQLFLDRLGGQRKP